MENAHQTASYQIISEAAGDRFRFFCDLSGAALCLTRPIRADTPEEALRIAWETEGRACFNRCHQCGRWVSNVMYNADELKCVDCAPWREQPRFCPHCGRPLNSAAALCPHCGRPVTGKGGDSDG